MNAEEKDLPQNTIAEVAPITPKKGVYMGVSVADIFNEEMLSPQQQFRPENFYFSSRKVMS